MRAGLEEIGPKLLGLDPRDLGVLNRRMDAVLRGHAYVKAPIDVACWDILGKIAGLPVYTLLGGAEQKDIVLYRAISQVPPAEMAKKIAGYRAEGYRKFQLKVGARRRSTTSRASACRGMLEPTDVLVADANTGWTMREAARVVAAVRDVDVYIEQPCPTYEECLSIRRRTGFALRAGRGDHRRRRLVRGLAEHAMDVINLKISKVGGLTKARLMRDLCVASGIPMTIEDTWGGDIVTAAIAHLARSTPAEFCFSATDFNSYGTVDHRRRRAEARRRPHDRVGPARSRHRADFDVLGDPVFTIR